MGIGDFLFLGVFLRRPDPDPDPNIPNDAYWFWDTQMLRLEVPPPPGEEPPPEPRHDDEGNELPPLRKEKKPPPVGQRFPEAVGQRIAYLRQHRKKDEDPFIAFKEVVGAGVFALDNIEPDEVQDDNEDEAATAGRRLSNGPSLQDRLKGMYEEQAKREVVKIKEEAEEAIRDIHSEMHKMRVKTGLVWSMEQKLAFDKSSLDAETDRLQRRNIIDEVAKAARDRGPARLANVANVDVSLKTQTAPLEQGVVLKQHKEFDRDTLLKKELEEHKNMCEKLIGEIDEVKASVESRGVDFTSIEPTSSEEKKALKEKLKALKDKNNQRKSDVNDLQDALDHVESNLDQVEMSCRACHEEAQMYHEALQKCHEAKAAGIESYNRKVASLTEKLNKAQFSPPSRGPQDEGKLKNQIVEQRNQIRNLEMEANVEFEKLEDDIDELEIEAQNLQDEMAALEAELARSQSEDPSKTTTLIEAFKKREKEVTPELERLAKEVEESYQKAFNGE